MVKLADAQRVWPWLVLFVGTWVAFALGLSGPFLLDDFPNFARLEYIDGSLNGYLLSVFDTDGRILNRPISYLSFWININDWPDNPMGFKSVNVVLHLLIGCVLALLLWRLPMPSRVSQPIYIYLLVGMWLLAPLQVSTVLYAVQRMTQLSMLFVLLTVLMYLNARNALGWRKQGFWSFLAALSFVLGVLSKENGILALPLLCLLEIYIGRVSKSYAPNWMRWAIGAGVVSFIIVFTYYSATSSQGYESRIFDMTERLQIQGAVVFEYLRLLVIPDITMMSLHHDEFEWQLKDRALGYGFFWLIHGAFVVVALVLWRKCPLISVGIFWFYIGLSLESSFIPLELMFEHRAYLPSLGIFIVLAYCWLWLVDKVQFETLWVKRLVRIFPLIILVGLTSWRSLTWSDQYAMTSKWAYFNKNSARSQYEFATELQRNGLLDHAHDHMLSSAEKFNRLGFFLYAWRLSCYQDKQGYFPELDKISTMNFTSEVPFQLRKLYEDWGKGQCIPEGFTYSNLDQFNESVLSMPVLQMKSRYNAKVLDYMGDFYRSLGNYNKTLEVRLKLYEVQPTVDTALKNAEMGLQFGVIEYARDYIHHAERANAKLPMFAADRSEIINDFKVQLKLIEGQDESKN